ncbi:hypothetical protein ACPZ19_29015 [Amycolatopsis lurida]
MSKTTKAALFAGVALGLTAVAGAPASAAAPSGEAGVLGGCSVFSPNTPAVVGNQIAGSALWDCALGPQEAAESNVRLYQDGNVVSEHKFWQQGAFRTTYTIGFVCTGSGTHTYYTDTFGWDTNAVSYNGGKSAEITLTC